MPIVQFTERQIQVAKVKNLVYDKTKSPQHWRFEIKNSNLHWNGKLINREWALKFAIWIIKELG